MITLTSDFGLKDPYVAEMKGVILTINPNATIIDITHDVEKFNIRMGAFMLASAAPYFPKGTVHLAVVDPGVGTERRAILVQTKQGFFVGPDNGVLMLAAKNQGIEHTYELTNPKFMLPKVSSTFHGRDIFAPAAAYIGYRCRKASEFGPEIADVVIPEFASVKSSNETFNRRNIACRRLWKHNHKHKPERNASNKNSQRKTAQHFTKCCFRQNVCTNQTPRSHSADRQPWFSGNSVKPS